MESSPPASSASTRLARVGHVNLAYDDRGEGSPTLLLIHGAFADRTHFAAQVEYFKSRHRVVAPDLRGHGESDVPATGFRVRDFVEDMLGLCQVAGIERAVLAGHSILGAGIALEVATARPDLVAGVALLDGAVPYPVDLRAAASAASFRSWRGRAASRHSRSSSVERLAPTIHLSSGRR